jgi:polyisoprenoid-binding protein YceI
MLCPLAQAGSYAIDESHTSVHFSVAHFERSAVRGRWLKVTGKIDYDVATKTGAVDLTIAADTVDSGLKVLDGVLTSAQFLNAEQYPAIRFQSSAFEFEGERLKAVNGALTLHGVTRPVQLMAERFQCGEIKLLALRRQVCGGEFRATIRRSDFGMTRYLPEVGDEVRLDIEVEASPVN